MFIGLWSMFPNFYFVCPVWATILLLAYLVYMSVTVNGSHKWSYRILNCIGEAVAILLVGLFVVPNVEFGTFPPLNFVPHLTLPIIALLWLVFGSILGFVCWVFKHTFFPSAEVVYVKPKEEPAPQNINVTIKQVISRSDDEIAKKDKDKKKKSSPDLDKNEDDDEDEDED